MSGGPLDAAPVTQHRQRLDLYAAAEPQAAEQDTGRFLKSTASGWTVSQRCTVGSYGGASGRRVAGAVSQTAGRKLPGCHRAGRRPLCWTPAADARGRLQPSAASRRSRGEPG